MALVTGCTPKGKKDSDSRSADSVAITTEENASPTYADTSEKRRVDTIQVSNGKLYIAVLEYTDFDPDKSIREFEVKETESDLTIFHSNSLRFYHEVIFNTGEVDEISIVPAYTIVSRNPFEVNLTFNFEGNLSIEYFEELIGNVIYDTAFLRYNLARMKFDFLNYKFVDQNGWKVKSHLQFTPKKCEMSKATLLSEINAFKHDSNSYKRSQLARVSFQCFLNGENPHHKDMMVQFKKSMTQSDSIEDCYPFIEYLD